MPGKHSAGTGLEGTYSSPPGNTSEKIEDVGPAVGEPEPEPEPERRGPALALALLLAGPDSRGAGPAPVSVGAEVGD